LSDVVTSRLVATMLLYQAYLLIRKLYQSTRQAFFIRNYLLQMIIFAFIMAL
jgi:4-hydroxybenzoate polyprenyltransferase